MYELIEENNDLRSMQDKHDVILSEQDFKVKELKWKSLKQNKRFRIKGQES